jgi:hypothetical protein
MTIPKIDIPPVGAGEDAAQHHRALTDERLVSTYMDFYRATLGIPPTEAELVELVRIRNAVAQSCAY